VEVAIALLVVAAGVGLRLAFVSALPTTPITDFQYLVELGQAIEREGVLAPSERWAFFNPGLPLTLATLFGLIPGPPVAIARTATAVATGLMSALPFLFWRGVLPLGVRAVTSLLLALWCGQIVFSGVVAQDNWVLLPVVALGALAVRALSKPGSGHPIASAVLYVTGVAFRQEMLVVLLPLLLAGAGLRWPAERGRRVAVCVLTTLPILLLLATHRYGATGRWALTSQHGGLAMLGAFVPGAAASGWIDPLPYVEDVDPALAKDTARLRGEAFGLAARLATRRPLFHAARMAAMVGSLAIDGAQANTAWSLYQPGVLAPSHKQRADAIGVPLARVLRVEGMLLLGAFLASLLVCGWGAGPAPWLLTLAIGLKVGIHTVTVMQGRYLLTATALAILVIGLGIRQAARRSRAALVGAVLLAAALVAVDAHAAPRLWAEVVERDHHQRRFTIGLRATKPLLRCVLSNGRLRLITPTKGLVGTVRPRRDDPHPGEVATADCAAVRPLPSGLALQLEDPYAPGGYPDRIVQRVEVEGREVLRHDLAAEPGSGWFDIPIGGLPEGASVRVQVIAVRPDPGPAWGAAAATAMRLRILPP
jgi:hypothetical protein